MAPFTISAVTPEDLPSMNDITTLAFYNNPRTMAWHIFPQMTADQIAAWRIKSTMHNYNSSDDSRYDKLVDDATGRIVAFAVWQEPRVKGSEEEETVRKAEKQRVDDEFKKRAGFPEGGNQRLQQDFHAQTDTMREKYVNTENDYVLKLIAVLPEYQGRGCGKMLIRSGLEIVDAIGARTELEATEQGKPIYEKYGFREIDEIAFDLESYGSSGRQITTCMMRDSMRPTAA